MFKVSALIAFIVVVCLPLFLHLGGWPFRLWDESRLAANAYEMHKNGNFIVTHYEGQPELWNTKPPLMIWLQVASIKIFGFSELSVRLPAAFAGLLTCLLLVYFSRKLFNNYLTGMLAAVVLVSTNGYIDAHAIRTGDYDGLLALFTTSFILSAFAFSLYQRSKWINVFFVSLVLAVLTKSVQPLVFLPGIGGYLLLSRFNIVKNASFVNSSTSQDNRKLLKRFVTACILSAAVVASYYLIRETMNPGYLAAIWENELGGRYFNALEENAAGPGYYALWLYIHMYTYWIWLLPVAFVAGLLSKNTITRNFTIFNVIVSGSYFIIISIAKTKLYWYAVPLLPLFGLQIGHLLYHSFNFLHRKIGMSLAGRGASLAIVCLVFLYPYYEVSKKVYRPNEYSWDQHVYPITGVLRDALYGDGNVNGHVIVYSDYDQHLRLYAQALRDKGQIIRFKKVEELTKGDIVLTSEEPVYAEIEKRYEVSLIDKKTHMRTYQIKSTLPARREVNVSQAQ